MILLGVTINLQCVFFFLIDNMKNGNLAKCSFCWLEDKESDVMQTQFKGPWILVFLEHKHSHLIIIFGISDSPSLYISLGVKAYRK